MTLQQIVSHGLQNLPAVQSWLNPFETSGTLPMPLTLDVAATMMNSQINLNSWQTVLQGSPAGKSLAILGGGVASFLAGGVGSGGPPPANANNSPDERIVNGSLKLSLACDGTVTVTADFQVTVQDTFDFDPGDNPIVLAVGTYSLGFLEKSDLSCDVNYTVQFSGPNVDPGHFTVQPPGRKPCMSQGGNCVPSQNMACNPITPVAAVDPNALVGPAGFGTQGSSSRPAPCRTPSTSRTTAAPPPRTSPSPSSSTRTSTGPRSSSARSASARSTSPSPPG